MNEGGMVHRISLLALKHMTGTKRRVSLHMIIPTKLVSLGELLSVAVAHHTGFKKLASILIVSLLLGFTQHSA